MWPSPSTSASLIISSVSSSVNFLKIRNIKREDEEKLDGVSYNNDDRCKNPLEFIKLIIVLAEEIIQLLCMFQEIEINTNEIY